MNEKLERYIQKKRAQEAEQRKNMLIEAGLFDKEYAPDNDPNNPSYPEVEYDENTGETKHYRIVAIELNDEEFAEFMKYYQQKPPRPQISVGIARPGSTLKKTSSEGFKLYHAIMIMAVAIFITGFIVGIVAGISDDPGYYRDVYKSHNFGTTVVYWIVTLASGILMLGFAQVLKLLNAINNKLD